MHCMGPSIFFQVLLGPVANQVLGFDALLLTWKLNLNDIHVCSYNIVLK